MKRGPVSRFILRWFISSLGIWTAAGILGDARIDYTDTAAIVISGLFLALANSVIKPIVVLLSLPAILFSLGLFMIVINGFMVIIVSKLYGGFEINSFGSAMIAGMIIGLVNYLVTTILEEK
jgi:putative membrane protein